jgi:RNA polymerase-binding transcription factor DksA
MSDNILSPEKLREYESILLAEREEAMRILNEINNNQKRGSKDNSGDLSSFSLHQADQGSDTDMMEREVYHLEQITEMLRNINLALNRIHDGTYGVCETCGEPIPEARLSILPYARYCIACKAKKEQRRR